LTPGEYEITASAEGYAPSTKLVEVNMNHEGHKLAPILKFQLEKASIEDQMSESLAGRSNMDTSTGLIMGQDQLDQDMMANPSAWTSIAEQYAPMENDLDTEDDEGSNIADLEGANVIPDYAYDYSELPASYPSQDDLEYQY
jgi:hypothetical protein